MADSKKNYKFVSELNSGITSINDDYNFLTKWTPPNLF